MNTRIIQIIGFFALGIIFGIVLVKAEVVSWFRIQEMFRFDSFHMYGIIGTAVVLSAIILKVLKVSKVKMIGGKPVSYSPMQLNITRHILAGSIFGLGWALTGACPGPLYAVMGAGYGIYAVMILSALLGTFTYGMIKDKLPH